MYASSGMFIEFVDTRGIVLLLCFAGQLSGKNWEMELVYVTI